MVHDFFPKDPGKTLEEVKAHLYSRLDSVRQTAVEQNMHGDSGSMARRDTLMNEAAFLAVLLDKLERS
jgi:division protein CdvB (Snf7/Vps24/ESCRT-III family)